MKLDSIRNEYKLSELSENNIDKNPIDQAQIWINNAINANVNEATAMSVSTIGSDGFPQSRIVLLKDISPDGFTFFTNYESSKGKSLKSNPAIGLLFFWPILERQIRISGFAEKTSISVSQKYFNSRPLQSQIAAMVSAQSQKIESREKLENQFALYNEKLQEKTLQCPNNWGGYIVKPLKIEFWQGRENRLHDRILYEKQNGKWVISRLAP